MKKANCGASMKPQQKNTPKTSKSSVKMANGGVIAQGGGGSSAMTGNPRGAMRSPMMPTK